MSKLQFSVYEFMAIMGRMDEELGGSDPSPESVFNEWYEQWRTLENRSEELPPMERADLLFDGKVTINAISEPHLREVVGVVEALVHMHRQLIRDEDPDADEEDLAMWETRLDELKQTLRSFANAGPTDPAGTA